VYGDVAGQMFIVQAITTPTQFQLFQNLASQGTYIYIYIVYMCMYMGMFLVYVCMYIHTHIHIHTNTFSTNTKKLLSYNTDILKVFILIFTYVKTFEIINVQISSRHEMEYTTKWSILYSQLIRGFEWVCTPFRDGWIYMQSLPKGGLTYKYFF
jgi:hypothetical protein